MDFLTTARGWAVQGQAQQEELESDRGIPFRRVQGVLLEHGTAVIVDTGSIATTFTFPRHPHEEVTAPIPAWRLDVHHFSFEFPRAPLGLPLKCPPSHQ